MSVAVLMCEDLKEPRLQTDKDLYLDKSTQLPPGTEEKEPRFRAADQEEKQLRVKNQY